MDEAFIQEVADIRRQLTELRREYEALVCAEPSPAPEEFKLDLQAPIADQIARRPGLTRIVERLTALEKRVDGAEARKRALSSAPR